MNGKYLLPTYRLKGYTPISGYNGTYRGIYISPQLLAPTPPTGGDYGKAKWSVGFKVFNVVTLGLAGAVRNNVERYGDAKSNEAERKVQKRKDKDIKRIREEAREKYARLEESTTQKQQQLESDILDRESELELKKQHLRSQTQITDFTDDKRREMNITDETLEHLYSKERNLMLEEFATSGRNAQTELDAIALKAEGPPTEGIPWVMVLGGLGLIAGGTYWWKNR